MSDKERLKLLKEVAGTQVYEQKRFESTKIMEDTSTSLHCIHECRLTWTDQKREKIAELLTYIDERLSELEEEKEELKEYQTKDRERRCLEYALHQRELNEVTKTLESVRTKSPACRPALTPQVEDERRNDIHQSNEKRKIFNEREEKVQVGRARMAGMAVLTYAAIRGGADDRESRAVDDDSRPATIRERDG